MLERVDFITSHGQELSLTIGDVSTGIIITEIAGLDPAKATLVSTSFAQRDGTVHQAARRESRDIIVRMALDSRFSGTSVSELRRLLYSTFMSKTQIRITFHSSDMSLVTIDGIVEDVVSPRFTKEPTFAMQVRCDNPDFIDPIPVVGSGEAYSSSMIMKTVDYQGTVESGLEFEIDIDGVGEAVGFTIQQKTPSGAVKNLAFNAQIQSLDTIVINTHPGQKSVIRQRAGSPTSILYGIDPQSHWPILEPGVNEIGIRVSGGTYQSYYEYKYHTRYGAL